MRERVCVRKQRMGGIPSERERERVRKRRIERERERKKGRERGRRAEGARERKGTNYVCRGSCSSSRRSIMS